MSKLFVKKVKGWKLLTVFVNKLQALKYATLLKRDFSTVGFKWNLIFLKVSNSNNLFEDFPAMSLTHNKPLITCNCHNGKLIWICIHLPKCCSEQNLAEVCFHIFFFRLELFLLYQTTKAFLAFTKRMIYHFHHKCAIQ